MRASRYLTKKSTTRPIIRYLSRRSEMRWSCSMALKTHRISAIYELKSAEDVAEIIANRVQILINERAS